MKNVLLLALMLSSVVAGPSLAQGVQMVSATVDGASSQIRFNCLPGESRFGMFSFLSPTLAAGDEISVRIAQGSRTISLSMLDLPSSKGDDFDWLARAAARGETVAATYPDGSADRFDFKAVAAEAEACLYPG